MKTKLMLSIGLLLLMASAAFAQGHGDIIKICEAEGRQGWMQACYNPMDDEYLVVWEDPREDPSNDIWGQFLAADGTLLGRNFCVCNEPTGPQAMPHLDFDPQRNVFLVVFEDHRMDDQNQSMEQVRGVFIQRQDSIGVAVPTDSSDADGSFVISDVPDNNIYWAGVSFNFTDRTYLVVWSDTRNTTQDVYGQLVDADGNLLPPPDPAGKELNFAIANNDTISEGVPDVSYSEILNEWMVVYGTYDFSLGMGSVFGQRVNSEGQLVAMDGTIPLAKASGVNESCGFAVSVPFYNGPDCLQARVQFNCENMGGVLVKSAEDWCECEVVWKANASSDYNIPKDLYGQRIGFYLEGEVYVAKFVDVNGNASATEKSQHYVSNAEGEQYEANLAYSTQDDEFLVAWGDGRQIATHSQNLFVQRLLVDAEDNHTMSWMADDRITPVGSATNIPVDVTEIFEGSLVAVAHNFNANEFLVAYTYNNSGAMNTGEVYARLFYGTPSSDVEESPKLPTQFAVQPNYPNPFNPETEIRFTLPKAGEVRVTVYDLLGRKINTLLQENRSAGPQTLRWNGRDMKGLPVASGIYVYKVHFDRRVISRKMTLLR